MFAVEWTESAASDALAYWLAANSFERQIIATAIEEIATELRHHPNCGESRTRGTRVFFKLPIAVAFRVLEHQRIVRVHATWYVRKA